MTHNNFSSPTSPPRSFAATADQNAISLHLPRPGSVRQQNEYFDAPLRAPPALPTSNHVLNTTSYDAGTMKKQRDIYENSLFDIGSSPSANLLKSPPKMPQSRCYPGIADTVITKAPSKKSSMTKRPDSIENLKGAAQRESVNLDESTTSSIVCRECNKCRCESCQNPKSLPSKWICNDKFHCSADNIVEHATCLCCVQAVFYHWAKDRDLDSDVSCADNPCSCEPDYFWRRWMCLGLISSLLPCVCCYPPLKLCVNACESTYGRYTSRSGCHCSNHQQQPNKLLST